VTEIWKAVPGYEGFYEVSDLGQVRSLPRIVLQASRWRTPIERFFPGIALRPGIASNGYPTVSLCGQTFCVHDLVLTSFVGSRPVGMVARHLDGVRTRSTLANLVWGTPVENADDSARHGTKVIGESHSTAKLTDTAAREIRRLKGVVPQSALAERFGVSPAAVQAVHDGRTWKHV
jgi:hypothetical protein